MQKITAIIRHEKFEDVRAALEAQGYPGLTTVRVEGHGKQKGLTQQFRGRQYTMDMLPKMKLELVVKNDDVDKIIEAIVSAAKTGDTGDGKIFLSPITKVVRIRTGETDETAI